MAPEALLLTALHEIEAHVAAGVPFGVAALRVCAEHHVPEADVARLWSAKAIACSRARLVASMASPRQPM
ncbi:MAG: hypothetical protein M0015_16725 [Betaproteobacteria bacterium]|nr:hypothetical protein [Betaproteobacteria bacterium]